MDRWRQVRPGRALRALLLILLVVLAVASVWRSQQPGGDVSGKFQPWFLDLFPFLKTSAVNAAQAQYQLLPVPADRFGPGVAALSQGANVEVIAFATDGSLPARGFSTVEVAGLLDDRKTVLLALPEEDAQLLQEMLMRDNVKLSYRLLSRTAALPLGQPAAASVQIEEQAPAEDRRPLAIKVSELSAGLPLASLREYQGQSDKFVTLMTVHETGTDPNKVKVTNAYTDVLVLDLLDANGAAIDDAITVANSVLLSVPEVHFDALVKGLLDKKAFYLLAQPPPIEPLVAPTVTPTATPVPVFSFEIPTGAIRSDVSALDKDNPLVVIVVVSEKDLEGKVVRYTSHTFDATVAESQNSTPGLLRVSLPLKADDKAPAKDFAALLADPSAQYYVLKPGQ